MTTSLAELARTWHANMCVISCPEVDLKGAQVMTVLETLPKHLNLEGAGIDFALAADFKGSASAKHCDSKARFVDRQKGEIVKGAADWGGRWMEGIPDETLKSLGQFAVDKEGIAIENSFWSTYWNGLASGALLTAAISGKTIKVEGPGRANNEKALYLRSMDAPEVRVVIVVSVDGGPITQIEKAMIPDVVLRTASNINRRAYDWAKNMQFCWCHFPTIGDLVESLAGKLNLSHDEDPKRAIHYLRLTLGRSAVFTVLPGKCGGSAPKMSLLRGSSADALKAGSVIAHASLLRAIKHADIETTQFLLDRKADVEFVDASGFCPMIWACGDVVNSPTCDKSLEIIKLLASKKANINEQIKNKNHWAPLHAAALWGAAPSVKLLLELRADPTVKTSDGQTLLDKVAAGRTQAGDKTYRNHDEVVRLLK